MSTETTTDTKTPTPRTHEEVVAYIRSLQVGERVMETSESALFGRCGTVYLSETYNSICVMWDKLQGEEGHMGTSCTEGARRVTDLLTTNTALREAEGKVAEMRAALDESLPALRMLENQFASSLSCDSRSHDEDRPWRKRINRLISLTEDSTTLGIGWRSPEEWASLLKNEHDLSDAYIRLRSILNAFDTPEAPTAEHVWEHTERKASELTAKNAELSREVERLKGEVVKLHTARFDAEVERDSTINQCEAMRGAAKELFAELYAHVPADDVENPPVMEAIAKLQTAISSTHLAPTVPLEAEPLRIHGKMPGRVVDCEPCKKAWRFFNTGPFVCPECGQNCDGVIPSGFQPD